jgi:DNA (cytosine-5)-methyltransferase 1
MDGIPPGFRGLWGDVTADAATTGSLFSGVAGLDRAVAEVTGAEPAWFVDNDPAACRVLAARFPGVPNLGDITRVGLPYSDEEWAAMVARAADDESFLLPLPDWSSVDRVHILTGGFPCQDLSLAGLQAGLRPGTRSGLWLYMAHAIRMLRPRLVVIENVRGILSVAAHSDVEPCPGCVGDGPDVVALRALGAVLGDLADLGYDAVWCGLRAADVGAPHERFRVFVAAVPAAGGRVAADTGRDARPQDDPDFVAASRGGRTAADSASDGRHEGRSEPARLLRGPDAALGGGAPAADSEGFGRNTRRLPIGAATQDSDVGVDRGVAPDANGESRQQWRPARSSEASGRRPLGEPGRRCTSSADTDGRGRPGNEGGAGRLPVERATAQRDRETGLDWGVYQAAIDRWARIVGRDAPVPRVTGPRGGLKLNPELPEWMQGHPAGWFTAVPGLSLNDGLKLAGNSVCPQQAAAALRWCLDALDITPDTATTEGHAA